MKLVWVLAVLWLSVAAHASDVNASAVEDALRAVVSRNRADRAVIAGSVHVGRVPMKTSAELVVDRVTVDPSGRMEARLRCQPATACLPFHATGETRATGVVVQHAHRDRIKRGALVMFVRERAGFRSRILAVALDAGVLGDSVRVRALDGKREIMRGRLCDRRVVRSES